VSLIVNAFDEWRECRAEYDAVLYAQYERAAEACNDALVNARGRARGVDPISLFMGPAVRAYAYASEELIEFWRSHPRVTYAMFEAQWADYRRAEEFAQ
jgi:hypothetical protein